MAKCTFWSDENLSGQHYTTDRSIGEFTKLPMKWPLENWNDEMSSLQIESGVWRLCEHEVGERFDQSPGLTKDLGPNVYNNMSEAEFAGIGVSAIILVRET